MKFNKILLLAVIPMSILSSTISNTYKNTNYVSILNLNNIDTRKSLTSMFTKNKLENTVHVGEETNLEHIKNSEIIEAITQEIATEIRNKTSINTLQVLDYDLEIKTIDNQPLPETIDLTNPINFKIIISAKNTSKNLKDKTIITCTVNYPIFDFDKFLEQGLLRLYRGQHPSEFIDFSNSADFKTTYNKSILKVNNVDQPILNKEVDTFNYFGESVFENNDNIDQTFYTPGSEKKIINKTEVSMSSAVKFETEFKFFHFGTSIELDFLKQKTVILGSELTISAPSMPVIVKPHHKTQALVYLNSFVSSQNISIDSDITGDASIALVFNANTPSVWQTTFEANVVDIVKYFQDIDSCPIALSINPDNQSIHIKNEAKVAKYEVGTFWHAIINPLD